MAATTKTGPSLSSKHALALLAMQILDISDHETHVRMLRERYLCPHFHILVIGRANAGKTTILEKVCNVKKGTRSIIYDKDGKSVSVLCFP